MIASRFTKAFQLIALALVFSVAQVYVMAGPVKVNTDPKAKETPAATQPSSEAVVTESHVSKVRAGTTVSAESQLLTAEAAAERMPLTAGSKALFNRVFSKRDVQARLATGNTFLKAKASFKDTFKSPGKSLALPQDDDADDGGGGKKGMWIAVGVVAAVLVIAIVALQHDRDITNVQGQ